jgi:hypothetical protein
VQQRAAGRAAEQRPEQTGTLEEHADLGAEPVNDDEGDAVDDELELAE